MTDTLSPTPTLARWHVSGCAMPRVLARAYGGLIGVEEAVSKHTWDNRPASIAA